MWKVIVIPADAQLPMYELEIGETFVGLQELVGGLIEHVVVGNCLTLVRYTDLAMWVNEDGISLQKPLNLRASFLYGVTVHGQCIYGDAILTGESRSSDDYGTSDVPDWATIEALNTHFQKVAANGS